MKTLDEVIAELEDEGLFADALYHLNKYRMTLDDIAEKRKTLEAEIDRYQEAVKNCETAENRHKAYELGYIRAMADYEELKNFWAESQANPPITWNELKTMEGKPVWVEVGNGWKGWVIIRKVTDSGIFSGSDGFIGIDTAYGMDTTWQAYRKERE